MLALNCLLMGMDMSAFSVQVDAHETIDELQKTILDATRHSVSCAALWLRLYRAQTLQQEGPGGWLASSDPRVAKLKSGLEPSQELELLLLSSEELDPASEIASHFPDLRTAQDANEGSATHDIRHLHVLVGLPEHHPSAKRSREENSTVCVELAKRQKTDSCHWVTESLSLVCVLVGFASMFSIQIDPSRSVDDLKAKIQLERADVMQCKRREIRLYRAIGESGWMEQEFGESKVVLRGRVCQEFVVEGNLMLSARRVDSYFPEKPPTHCIHLVVVFPTKPTRTFMQQANKSLILEIEEGDDYDRVMRRVKDNLGFFHLD